MFKIEIINDPDPTNPREWDNLGTFQIYHRRYASPDPIVREPPFLDDSKEVGLKVWGYDHGGVIYKTGETNPFSCPWDSGFAGIIFASKAKIREWFGVRRITKNIRARAIEVLQYEVETYSQYINGEVYAYLIRDEDTGHVVDACGGFYSEEDARTEAQAYINN